MSNTNVQVVQEYIRLKDGKIVEMWGLEDSFSQLKQLGYQIHEPVVQEAG